VTTTTDLGADADRSVAFVRNVMIGRQGLDAATLLGHFTAAGAVDVRSHLATGNVTFRSTVPLTLLRAAVEDAIAGTVGHREPVFIRALDLLARWVAEQPFGVPAPDVHERTITFTDPHASVPLPIRGPHGSFEVLEERDGDFFAVTRLVSGRAGHAGRHLEKLLRTPVTTRNWNTVERIVRAAAGR
jgi:uncharacterized protein (DUF1697 family)